MRRIKNSLCFRFLCAFTASAFSCLTLASPVQGQTIAGLNLPVPGALVNPSPAYVPVLLKGMTVQPNDPFRLDFIVDSGNTGYSQEEIKKESEKLVKYFLAAMTVPQNDLWVNLSPYEQERIIPEDLGKTDLGRDLLAQDYLLKQLTASLMYPEKELGKRFWEKIRKKSQELYGTTEIPVDTFNKVWILPESATVYEHGQTVYVVESRLRVMLDSDYRAMAHAREMDDRRGTMDDQFSSPELQSSIIREVIIPEIEKEVNEGENFAPLRQMYHSLILAKWYKETIKESLLSKVYVDQKKMAGVELDDETVKDRIYERYMEAYQKGVYNYIKEDYDPITQDIVAQKYFSGGFKNADFAMTRTSEIAWIENAQVGRNFRVGIEIDPQQKGSDQAILGDVDQNETQDTPLMTAFRRFFPHPADPLAMGREAFQEQLDRFAAVVSKHLFQEQEIQTIRPATPAELRAMFQEALPRDGRDWREVLERFDEQIRRFAINHGNPRYASHLFGQPIAVTIFVELLIGALNANQVVQASSNAATFAELEVIRWLTEILEFPESSGGVIVDGGTAANHMAFLMAQNHAIAKNLKKWTGLEDDAIPDVKKEGLVKISDILRRAHPGFSGRFVFFVSEAAHYSHKKIGGYMGIGAENVISIKTKDGRMDPETLEAKIREHAANGDIILGVVATAGTTEMGKFDYLPRIAELAKKHDLWLHVDAAHGGAVKFSKKYKKLIEGLEKADSVTIDPHKWFYIPYALGALIVKDKRNFDDLRSEADYLFRKTEEDSGVENLGRVTMQGSKRFDALKLWFALQVMGVKNFESLIDHTVDETRKVARWIREEAQDLELISEPDINLLTFRFVPAKTQERLQEARAADDLELVDQINEILNHLNREIIKQMLAEGYDYFSQSVIRYTSYRTEGDHPASNNLVVLLNVNNSPFVDQDILREIFSTVMEFGNRVAADQAMVGGVERHRTPDTRHIAQEKSSSAPGGIDMNAIPVKRQGESPADIHFEPGAFDELLDMPIDGFAPVIINVTPIPSVLPLLGLEPEGKRKPLRVSSLN